MNKNFSKRFLTSLILSSTFLLFIFTNKILWSYLLIVTSILSFFEFSNLIKKKFKKEKKKIFLSNILCFFYLIMFSYIGNDFYNTSPITLLLILLICISSDIGGYVIGKSIGGKKLTKISPNKTVSGSIGSFLFSFIPILIYIIIYKQTGNLKFYYEQISLLMPLCLFLSLICQLGDLFISYFKRQARVKDTGSLLPGHGGLLDRIDGIVFVLPSAIIIDKLFY